MQVCGCAPEIWLATICDWLLWCGGVIITASSLSESEIWEVKVRSEEWLDTSINHPISRPSYVSVVIRVQR